MARPIEEENKYAQSLEKDLDIVKASSNNIDTVPKKQPPIFRSMDDIEVIQRRDLERIISQATVKSKDDLYIHNEQQQTKDKSNKGTKSLFIASVITNGISNIVNVAGISAAIVSNNVAQIISSINIGLQIIKRF